MLALRAQIYVGLRDDERAGDTITYLRSIDLKIPVRIEETPAGVVLTPEPNPSTGWPDYLRQRLDDRLRAERTGGTEKPEPAIADIHPAPPGFARPFMPDAGGVVFPGQRDAFDDADFRRFRPRGRRGGFMPMPR